MRRIAQCFFIFCILFSSGPVLAQSIQMQADASKIYAGMPFTLSMVVSDVEEQPQPDIEPFEIEGASVKFVGVQPRVSSMTTIINGRRSSRKDVSFVFSYEVTPSREGLFEIPVITARQGKSVVSSQGRATFEAREVETTRDMRIALVLPERALWVGETFDVELLWSLRTNVSGQVFSIPLYGMSDYFEVEDPKPSGGERVIYLDAGQRKLPYAFSEESVMLGGLEYRQFRTKLRVTALKSGTIELAPTTVLADLSVGRQADFFGFGRSEYAFYKAEDEPRQLVVRDLPQVQRPAAFVNALGSDFDISVSADRSIVKLGDPIMLTIDISSPMAHEGLILPSLSAAGLNEQLFSVSTEAPIGETIEAGHGRKIRRFSVPIRVKSERVKEIPPLAFAYFDPKREQYQTVRSEPIALSVTAVDKIGVEDVVLAQVLPSEKVQPSSSDVDAGGFGEGHFQPASLNLDFGLNACDGDLEPKFWVKYARHLMIGLYVSPFVFWAFLLVLRRSRRRVARYSEQRESAKVLREALSMAKRRPACESASELSNALNAYLSSTEASREAFASIFEELGACAYNPEDQMRPLNDELLQALREKAKTEVCPKYTRAVLSILSMVLAFTFVLSSSLAVAEEVLEAPLVESVSVEGRAGVDHLATQTAVLPVEQWDLAQWRSELRAAESLYHEAMGLTVRAERLAKFKSASARYERLAQAFPSSVALWVDWGNACLNASDFACASLAYKRALSLSPGHRQAKANRDFILSTLGDSSHVQSRAFSSFFFLNDVLSRTQRLLCAAVFFAIGIFLIVPWHPGAKRVLRIVSILPLVMWFWFMSSVFFEPRTDATAVVVQELWLKTADNVGAANSSSKTLSPGMDVEIIEARGDWYNVRASNGRQGWVRASGIVQ